VISMHCGQTLQGSWVTPCSQLRVLARMRAVLVLPTPRAPVNRKACATRPESMAFCRVRLTCSCPVSSENDWGRYFLARTSYDVPLDKGLNLAGHLVPPHGRMWPRRTWKSDERGDEPVNVMLAGADDSRVYSRHTTGAAAVASFRTWRSSRPAVARGPTIISACK